MPPQHPSLIVASRQEADSWSQNPGLPIRGVIAIVDAEERPCLGFESIPDRLRLDFEDVAVEASALGVLQSRGPTRDHAERIVAFARRLAGGGGLLLCHCTAGRSRSPAAALICLAVWLGPGAEADAAAGVFRIRPTAYPHRGLVGFADQVLGRSGRLLAALEAAQPKWE